MEVYNILFNRLLSETAKRQASDLHLSSGSVPVIRKDGRLIKLEQEKIIEQPVLLQIIKSFLEEEELKILEEKRELTVVKKLGGNFRFKINIYYQKNLLAASLRIISEEIKNFAALNVPPAVAGFTKLSSGLLIMAGPYGGGKTTTISAIIEHINQNYHKRILTIEDPIEVMFTSKQSVVEQRQIGQDVLSLIDGLEYCQQEDIDILAISDIKEELSEKMP
ncbi:MAG: ATPase, T2SS/T4P/T4SS family, partial [Patescibacteria group bacterium]